MVVLNRIYTRAGDQGSTMLGNGGIQINLDLHGRPCCRTLLAMLLNSCSHLVIAGLGRRNKCDFLPGRCKLLGIPALPAPGAAKDQRD